MNDAFCRMTGYAQQEILGKPFLSLASSSNDGNVPARIQDAVANGRSLRTELQCQRRDGTTFWFGIHVMPAGDPAGVDLHALVLGRDITERLRAGEQQRATQELLASVFASVDAAVAIVSEEGRCLMANPGMSQLLGYPPGGLDGVATLDIVAPRSRDIAARARAQQLADGKPYTVPISVLLKNGAELPTHLTAVLVAGNRNRRCRVVTLAPKMAVELPPRVQVAGKLKLIGLDEVRTALGARWDAFAERILQSAEHVIQRRLGPRDTFSRTHDNAFLVCFADLSEQEASFQAAMIAREIRTKLIGQGEEPATSRVGAVTVSLPLKAGQHPEQEVLARMMDEQLRINLSTIHAAARETLRETIDGLHGNLEPITGGKAGEARAAYACLPVQAECRICAALAALPSGEAAAFDLDGLRLRLAAESCAQAALAGSPGPVLVEVTFDGLEMRNKLDRYLAILSQLDHQLQRRLTLMLSELPLGLPQSRLLDIVQRLRPYCGGFGLQLVEPRLPPFHANLPNGTLVAINANEWTEVPDTQIAQMVGKLRTSNGRLLVRQVGSRDAAMALRTLGVDLISMGG